MSIDKQIAMNNRSEADGASETELKKIVKESLELSQETYHLVKKIHRFMVWQSVFNVLKILVILIPLFLGYFFLTPYIKEMYGDYKKLLGFSSESGALNVDLNALPQELLKKLK